MPSRAVKALRLGFKKNCSRIASSFGSKSYPLFGVPSGLTEVKIDTLLTQEEKLSFCTPKGLEKPFWRFENKEACIAAQGHFLLKNGTATHLGGNLDHSGRLVTTYLKPVDGKEPANHDLFNFSQKRFRPKMTKANRVISLATGWQDTFYHWMHEVLPRLALVQNLEGRLYIDQGKRFQKESLQFLGIDPKRIIDASQFQGVVAKELIVPANIHLPTARFCHFLRSHLGQVKRYRRLYLSRNDADKRRVVNELELLPILQRHGFEVKTTAGLTFREQAELFASAEIVVGPHGAGFSNLAFCEKGTPFLELFSPAYTHTCYWHLASAAGLPYHFLFGEGKRYGDFVNPHLDLDIELDPKKFEEALVLALADRQ